MNPAADTNLPIQDSKQLICLSIFNTSFDMSFNPSSDMSLFGGKETGFRGFGFSPLPDRNENPKDAIFQPDGLDASRLEILSYEV
jgi:hypothetical protein